jgi:hypothetical protein
MDIEFLRSFRIGEYAIFDFLVSFIGIYLISKFLTKFFLKFKIYIPTISWMYFTLPIGFLFHLIFKVNTQMNNNILDLNGHYILKLFFIVLVVLGIKGIKKTK